MKEAGTVMVFLVSSNISSLRVITSKKEQKKKKGGIEEEGAGLGSDWAGLSPHGPELC